MSQQPNYFRFTDSGVTLKALDTPENRAFVMKQGGKIVQPQMSALASGVRSAANPLINEASFINKPSGVDPSGTMGQSVGNFLSHRPWSQPRTPDFPTLKTNPNHPVANFTGTLAGALAGTAIPFGGPEIGASKVIPGIEHFLNPGVVERAIPKVAEQVTKRTLLPKALSTHVSDSLNPVTNVLKKVGQSKTLQTMGAGGAAGVALSPKGRRAQGGLTGVVLGPILSGVARAARQFAVPGLNRALGTLKKHYVNLISNTVRSNAPDKAGRTALDNVALRIKKLHDSSKDHVNSTYENVENHADAIDKVHPDLLTGALDTKEFKGKIQGIKESTTGNVLNALSDDEKKTLNRITNVYSKNPPESIKEYVSARKQLNNVYKPRSPLDPNANFTRMHNKIIREVKNVLDDTVEKAVSKTKGGTEFVNHYKRANGLYMKHRDRFYSLPRESGSSQKEFSPDLKKDLGDSAPSQVNEDLIQQYLPKGKSTSVAKLNHLGKALGDMDEAREAYKTAIFHHSIKEVNPEAILKKYGDIPAKVRENIFSKADQEKFELARDMGKKLTAKNIGSGIVHAGGPAVAGGVLAHAMGLPPWLGVSAALTAKGLAEQAGKAALKKALSSGRVESLSRLVKEGAMTPKSFRNILRKGTTRAGAPSLMQQKKYRHLVASLAPVLQGNFGPPDIPSDNFKKVWQSYNRGRK